MSDFDSEDNCYRPNEETKQPDNESFLGFKSNGDENSLNDDEMAAYQDCQHSKVERVEFYKDVMPSLMFAMKQQPYVNIEGPEYCIDYSYWLINDNEVLLGCEEGIPLGKNAATFVQELEKRDRDMEWRFT